jgi:Insulinase (Peptidase family M16)
LIARLFNALPRSVPIFPVCMRTLFPRFLRPSQRPKPIRVLPSNLVSIPCSSACFRPVPAPLSHGRWLASLQAPRSTNTITSPSLPRFSRSTSTMAPSATDHASLQNGIHSTTRVHVLSSQIEKPELDDRSYRLVRLFDNKLEALLVHDPKTEKSSAAMDVHVGHLSDPKDFPGLAHALEHCLFLGI